MTREEELEKLIREQEADDSSFQAPQPNTVPWHELNDLMGLKDAPVRPCPVHGYANMTLDPRERAGGRCLECHNEHERMMRRVGRRQKVLYNAQKERARKRRKYHEDPVARERQKAASARQRAKMKGEGA